LVKLNRQSQYRVGGRETGETEKEQQQETPTQCEQGL